jgi:hypothetical protein
MPSRFLILAPCAALAVLGLAGCGGAKTNKIAGHSEDPALAHALAGPLMTDANLASHNRALAAISGGGAEVVELPLIEKDPESIAAAKSDAARLAGGKITLAPLPSDGGNPVLRDAVTAVQRAAGVAGPGKNCGAKASYAMTWSLQLPQPFVIYPRGHLVEAAGNDSDGCRLRVVRYVSPVEPGAIIDFYYTRAGTAHFESRHRQADGRLLLEGTKGAAAFAVQAHKRDDGLTDVDLVVNGV